MYFFLSVLRSFMRQLFLPVFLSSVRYFFPYLFSSFDI